MEYKYRKGQLFGKRLNIPKHIMRKIYQCNLTFLEYIQFELDGKIPTSCLIDMDQQIIHKYGLERSKTFDWELIDGSSSQYELKNYILSLPVNADVMSVVYEYVKQKMIPIHYSDGMKKTHPECYFEFDNDSQFAPQITAYNRGLLSLETALLNWVIFKDKDLTYVLLHDSRNTYHLTVDEVSSYMSKYAGLTSLFMKFGDIYKIIFDVSHAKDSDKVIKDYLNGILYSKDDSHYEEEITNSEYEEIFHFLSLKDYLDKQNSSKSYNNRILQELKELPEGYFFHTPFPFSVLTNNKVLDFIGIYGIKNVVDFDLECGGFFSNNNCEMLLLMYDMYLHYAGNEHDPNKNIFTNTVFDENGNYVDLPYTKDQFYEAMRRMITYGPSDWNYSDKAPDYRTMTGEYRVRNPRLFLNDGAPEELKRLLLLAL